VKEAGYMAPQCSGAVWDQRLLAHSIISSTW
jgi:hypothetical protein